METQDNLFTVMRFKATSHSFCLKKYILEPENCESLEELNLQETID